MWHEKQNILPGQTSCPKRLQGTYMENKIFPPPSGISDIDFLAESSRKRKSTDTDQQGTISESVFEYCSPRESNLQRRASSLFGINMQGNTRGLFLNQTPQTPQSVEPITLRHQFVKDQFLGQNDFPATWQNSNGNFHKTGVEKISNSSLSVAPQSFHHKGPSPFIKMSTEETFTVSNWQPQAYNMLHQTETHKPLPFHKSCNSYIEKAEVGPALQDLMSFGHRNHLVTDNPPLEVCNSPSESLRPLELLSQSFVKPDGFAVDLDGRACSREASKFGISFDLKHNGHSSNTAEINDTSTVGTSSQGASARTERNENGISLQNEVQSGSAPLGIGSGDNFKEKDQGHRDGNVKIMKNTEGSDVENSNHSLTEETSRKSSESPANFVGHGQRNELGNGSHQLDEKSKSHSGKVAPTVAEKLWDGSLQLNSSVTVPAVAFFKSGEKIPDAKWSEFVEVKGKVRLEAFEKYIQDLPRSRNRGLMVISLCWKEGSSETGLAGMKEVAKGYKVGERVGFAQLSPGIDLYICPRSDTIITILAKYGFFKGMAAVEDNQDSLIGCVVWRRNRTSSKPVAKKSEKKNRSLSELPLNSPSDSSTQQTAVKTLSPTQPAREPVPFASVTGCTTLEGAGNNGTESKSIKSSKVQLEAGNSSTNADPLLTPLVPSNSSSISVGLQTSPHSDSASLQGPRGQLLEVEPPLTHNSGLEKSKASLELQKSDLPLQSNIRRQPVPTPDDDDLPEFDFRTSCGMSQTPRSSNPLNAATFDKRLPAEGFRKMEGTVPSTVPIVQAILVSNQRRSENSTRPSLPLDANQGMPPLKKVFERQHQIPVLPILEEKHNFQGRATTTPVSATAVTMPKNLFDDDDDMPEWFPPDLELHKKSLAGTSRPPTTSILSKVPSSTFESFPPGPPRPPLLSPSPAAARPPFPPQVVPRAFHCPITLTVKPAQPRPADGYIQRGPSSLTGFNSNPVLRPQLNPFDVKLPHHHAGRTGWRP